MPIRRAASTWGNSPRAFRPDPRTPRHQPAYRVEVVDTTGCGDVFHGAYAAGLAQGVGTAERVRLATATAALKATRHGGQAGIPSRAAVEAFLAQAVENPSGVSPTK